MSSPKHDFIVVLHKSNVAKYPSRVWRVFGRLSYSSGSVAESKKVFCKLCSEKKGNVVSYSESTGTETLLQHISKEHPDEDLSSRKANKLLDSWKKAVTKGTEVSTETNRAKKFVLARDLALWISEDLLPFSFVEGTGLKRFLVKKGVAPSVSDIPCRTTISRKALDDAYDALKRTVIETLPKDSHFHVSTDTWTDRYRQLPYIAVVLHYIDDLFRLKCVPLKTDYFPAPHTGNSILEEIRATLREFELAQTYWFAAITDSASNMVRGFRDNVHIRCADHRMHRALTADFTKTSIGKRILQHRETLMRIYRRLIYKKKMIAHFAKEWKDEKYLDALKQAEDIEKNDNADDRFIDSMSDNTPVRGYDPKGLRADVPTRWGSVCHLFESAAASHEVLNEVLMKTGSHELLLNPGDMGEIRAIAEYYRVILDLMILMQSSTKPTINMVVIGVIDIENTLDRIGNDSTIQSSLSDIEFREEMADELKTCVQGRMRPFRDLEVLGALLDPEMKKIPKIRAEVTGGYVAKFLVSSIHKYASPNAPEMNEEVSVAVQSPVKKGRSSLIARYSSNASVSDSIVSEVDRYLSLSVNMDGNQVETNQDKILLWWRTNSKLFPTVAKLAKIVLSIPATSAEPERRFSLAGNVLREKRCSMEPLTMAKTLFIHDNKNFLCAD